MREHEDFKFDALFQKVKLINERYKKEASATGENFNIFSIMNMEYNEVYTHSAIIGELLNPKGTHGFGDKFLIEFINILNNNFKIEIKEFSKLTSEKIVERSISLFNDWDEITGGRIDIIIEDKEQILLIENKLLASDQSFQLIRYYNYAKTKNKDFYIVYLTLDGKLVGHEEKFINKNNQEVNGKNFNFQDKSNYEKSKAENKQNCHQCLYYPISYRSEILKWIEKCIDITKEIPLISETLKQYRNNLKYITNQTISQKMSEELVNEMKNSIGESFEIANNIHALKLSLYSEFFDCIETFATSNGMVVDKTYIHQKKDQGLYLTPDSWKNKGITIGIIFENDYNGLFYGVLFESNFPEVNKAEIINKLKLEDYNTSDLWIWKFAEEANWSCDAKIWQDVAEGSDSKIYREITEGIIKIVRIQEESNV